MRKIYFDCWYCQRTIRLLTVPLLILLVADPSVVGGPLPDQVVRLSLEDARPMAKAVAALERRYGWRITYEDVPIVHPSEVVDKTSAEFRNSPIRMLLPIGGRIDLTFYFSDKLAQPDPVVLIESLMKNHEALGNAGRFRLEQSKGALHVIPAQVKNAEGKLVDVAPILGAKSRCQRRNGVATKFWRPSVMP